MAKHRVLVLTRYGRRGASSRLRSLQYLPFIEGPDLEFTVRPLVDDTYLAARQAHNHRPVASVAIFYLRRLVSLLQVRQYDLVWIEKELFPFLPPWFERLVQVLGVPYIVDYDDAIFHVYDRSRSTFVRWALGAKIDVVMRNAACVIAGNEYLAQRARDAGARAVHVLPTVVNPERYRVQNSGSNGKPVIGWIGSPSTEKYVLDVKNALTRVCAKYRARLLLVGASERMKDKFPGVDTEIRPWDETSEAELVAGMDIGIMPLSDNAWERGKCGYKLIQYMACGVPVIASPVGVNVEIVKGNNAGILAETDQEWEDALEALILSPQKRAEMGVRGRKAVEDTYSVKTQSGRLANIIQMAMSNRESH